MNRIFISPYCNPYINVSLNKSIQNYYTKFPENRSFLFLSKSSRHVSIGKHQNCWKSCKIDLMNKNSIPLIRRTSGGKTYYADEGHLSFSFMSPNINSQRINHRIINNTLEYLNLTSDKPIYNEHYSQEDSVIKCEGAIFHSVDKSSIPIYIRDNTVVANHNALDITNITDIDPSLDMNDLREVFIQFFELEHPDSSCTTINSEWLSNPDYLSIYEKITDNDYIHNDDPEITIQCHGKFPSGNFDFHITHHHHIITKCHVYSDCGDVDFPLILEKSLLRTSILKIKKTLHRIKCHYQDKHQDDLDEIFSLLDKEISRHSIK